MQNVRPPRANGIRTDETNSFAHHTMSTRLPSIIEETLALNPDYPPLITRSLRELAGELVEDRPIRSIAPPAPDWGNWEEQWLRHRGESWLHTEWFFAEHLFFRRLIESVRWWETGRDPFAPFKAREYAGSGHRELLLDALEAAASAASNEERLGSLFLASLWGNRIDLSHRDSAALGAKTAGSSDLLIDDRERILGKLLGAEARGNSIHLITDNAGSELTADLLLADQLATLGFIIFFHVKMHPTYVSDATASDIRSFIRALAEGSEGPLAQAAGERLEAAFKAGAIRIVPDLFWNSGRFIGELPPRLLEPLRSASLVIFKGDVNYRRLSKDALWEADSGFADVVGTFPASVAMVRTMKSDTIFGLPPGLSGRLDSEDPQWRTNGRRGVIQYFP